MSSPASADPVPSTLTSQSQDWHHESDSTKSNHDLPARTMPEDEPSNPTYTSKDDPATAAASEELKHTSISDKVVITSQNDPTVIQPDRVGEEDSDMNGNVKEATPETDPTDAQDEEMRERLSSPKKKRGRDQDEDSKDSEDNNTDEPGSSADGSVVNGNRTTRSAPEKKRPRDTSEDYSKAAEETSGIKVTAAADSTEPPKTTLTDTEISKATEPSQKPIFGGGLSSKLQTSSSAFASSGFASLASSSTSPFGSIGATKPSIFGGSTLPAVSGFGALSGAKPLGSSSFASSESAALSEKNQPVALGFGSGSTSGFGGLGSGSGSVFGSSLGNGFAAGAGTKLSSFAAPVKETPPIGGKATKAFGAPDSDEEEGSDDDGSDGGAAVEDEESGNVGPEDKKKSKITKVHIEDGESGEATLLQMRSKIFAMESNEVGWKERGVGTLKVNVPKSCASFDLSGAPISGSFDASGLEDEDSAVPCFARLIMRQENTHRVILNTAITKGMVFQDKPSTSTAQILFTAFEGEESKPVNMLLKMSEANARLFRSEVESIKREL